MSSAEGLGQITKPTEKQVTNELANSIKWPETSRHVYKVNIATKMWNKGEKRTSRKRRRGKSVEDERNETEVR